MSKRYGTTEDRFYSYVVFGPDCWEWRGPTSEGYGRLRVGDKRVRAHRFAYEREYGSIPPGLVVRHRCDNPLCVNPNHLEVGTHAENVRDMDERNRRSVGVQRPGSKLREDEVAEIRASSLTHRDLGRQFGVSHCVIGRIKRGEDWKHV